MHADNVSQKSGMPPGTPIYIGDTPPEPTLVRVLRFSEEGVIGFVMVTPDELDQYNSDERKIWVHITGLHNASLIGETLSLFSIHPLVIEDILNTRTRSKIEEFDEYLFIVLTNFHKESNSTLEEQFILILFRDVLITCSERNEQFLEIEEKIMRISGRFRQKGVDYLAYSIIDTIVDRYFEIIEQYEDQIETLEDEVINAPTPDTVSHVQMYRHDLIWFRRKIWSLREVIVKLERTDSPLIHDSTHIYLRDVYDHIIKIAEDVDVYREMAEGLMEIYLSKISNNTNEIMKMLTLIANIFIPLTFIAGIYGMNFAYMPELHSPYGYPAVLVLMALVSGSMLWYFRKKGWI